MAIDIRVSVSVFGCRVGSSPDLDDQSTAETPHDRPIIPFVQVISASPRVTPVFYDAGYERPSAGLGQSLGGVRGPPRWWLQ